MPKLVKGGQAVGDIRRDDCLWAGDLCAWIGRWGGALRAGVSGRAAERGAPRAGRRWGASRGGGSSGWTAEWGALKQGGPPVGGLEKESRGGGGANSRQTGMPGGSGG